MKRSYACIAIICFGILLAPVVTHADPAVPIGQIGLSGQGFVLFQSNGMNFIDWCPLGSGSGMPAGNMTCGVSGSGLGFLTFSGGSGGFSSVGTVPGQILDLATQTSTMTGFTAFPTGASASISNVVGVDGHNDWQFTGTSLVAAKCTPSATSACVGPLLLSEVGSQTTVSLAILGTVMDSADKSSANWEALLSGEFNEPLGVVEAQMQSATGAFADAVSGSLTTFASTGTGSGSGTGDGGDPPVTTPEPQAAALFLLGLLLLGAGGAGRMLSRRNSGESSAAIS